MILKLSACYLAANMITFLAFAWDKHCARVDNWRIPERRLLFMALVGGSVGAVIAQHWLRHKTRKEPFRTMLYSIIVLQVVALATMSHSPTRIFLATFLAHIVSGIVSDLRQIPIR